VDVRAWLTGNVFYPLWDVKDRSHRLREWRSLEQSQWLPPPELRRRQWEAAGRIIDYAYRNCAFYRQRLGNAGVTSGADVTPDTWTRIPVLTKRDVRENADNLLSERFRKEDLVQAKTGGSTGTALILYFDRRCQDRRNAAALRSDRWAGWRQGMRTIFVWGNPHLPVSLKARLRNALYDRMEFLDTMEINEASLRGFLASARKPSPFAIKGHAHSIFIVARWLEQRDERAIRPRSVITTSMMLLRPERETIERVFGCRVTDRYGCEEVGLIACECEKHQGMHLNVDHLLVECLRDDGTPASPGEEGRLVITDLVNLGMPLIRYRIEDVGVLSDRACPCGRGLPLLERITGRTADFMVRSDGSLVAGVSLVERTLTALPGIEQMQIIQESVDTFRLKLVPMAGYGRETEEALARELRSVFGDAVRTTVELVDRIPQDPSGKYRFSISHVPY
jgi:phenylacetate-coenzyme A ligase PaaK-like adenylate-forming protein